MKFKVILIFTIMCFQGLIYAQAPDASKKEKVKTGFSFGALPAIAYDSDLG
jgi:hypothetical protein